jgi:hypothetical protein
VDYVDDNVTPEGIDDTEKLARPCTEPVPLFSQANMAIAYTPGPAVAGSRTYTIQYTFQACFVYPYRQTGSDFTIEADAVVLNNNTDPQWQPLIPDPHFTVDNTFPFSPDTFEFIEAEPQVMTVTAPVAVGAPLLDLDIVITARTLKDGVVVRQTPASDYEDENEKVHVRLNLQLPATLPAGMTTTSLNFWAEAIDPRFNWVGDGADGKYWRSSVEPGAVDNGQTEVASPNAPLEMLKTFAAFTGYVPYYDPNPISSLNAYMLTHPKALSDYFNIVVDGVRDGDANAAHCDPLTLQARAHVANRPLQSVGELGYLPIARWQTLSLYDHGHDNNRNLQPASGYHPVLDYFTLMASNTPPRRGRVNLNTSVTGALAAVFNDLPLLTENPSTPTIPRVRMNGDSMVLANLVRRKGPFTNLSELGKIWNKPDVDQLGVFAQGNLPAANNPLYYIAQTCGAPGFGEFEREAAIRNTCNLLTTRQQIYTIILRADSFVPRYAMTHIREGNVLATAQAVAQIWRDPVATDCGGVMKHKCFVQLFKLIDE